MTEKKMKIILDTREDKLIEVFKTYQSRIPIEIEVSQLDVADIVCSERVGIERKGGFDFVISLTDNRLFEQLERLKAAYESPLIILEDFSDFVLENVGVRKSSIYGSMSYIAYKMGIPVLPSCSLEDTALIVERIAYREQIKDKAHVIARSAPKGLALEGRRCFIMEGLELCGPEKARVLIDHFGTPYEIFRAIMNTEILYTRNGNPKGVKGPLEEVKGFSHRFVEKNQKLLSESALSQTKVGTKKEITLDLIS